MSVLNVDITGWSGVLLGFLQIGLQWNYVESFFSDWLGGFWWEV